MFRDWSETAWAAMGRGAGHDGQVNATERQWRTQLHSVSYYARTYSAPRLPAKVKDIWQMCLQMTFVYRCQ